MKYNVSNISEIQYKKKNDKRIMHNNDNNNSNNKQSYILNALSLSLSLSLSLTHTHTQIQTPNTHTFFLCQQLHIYEERKKKKPLQIYNDSNYTIPMCEIVRLGHKSLSLVIASHGGNV